MCKSYYVSTTLLLHHPTTGSSSSIVVLCAQISFRCRLRPVYIYIVVVVIVFRAVLFVVDDVVLYCLLLTPAQPAVNRSFGY